MTSYRNITFGIAILALSLANSASAQREASDSVAVNGTIRSLADGSPVPQARVALAPLDRPGDTVRVVETGTTGEYRFDGVPVGRYLLTVTASGFETTSVEAQVIAGNPLRLSVSLESAPVSTPSDSVAVATGRVVDAASGQPVADVIVSVEGSMLSTQTDAEGRFRLEGVPPGPQILRARMIGYSQRRIPVSVPVVGRIEQDITMAANALLLEGVTVVADAVSRAEGELGTATVIEREAIREQNATSLRGVLELVPGVQAQPPGLDNVQQIALRTAPTSGSADFTGGISTMAAGAFGTLIILDGVPLSNNANLQTLGPRNEVAFTTSANGGIDLRKIPAATLERVEVIRGVPSARYGDLTQGVIIVDTRAGAVPPDLLARYDARTSELSFIGGWGFRADDALSGTIDAASTQTSPGLTDSRSSRFAAQLAHRWRIGDRGRERFVLDSRVDGFYFEDDRPPTANNLNRSSRNEDSGFRITERARFRLNDISALHATASISMVRQSTSILFPRTLGAMPITDRLTEGRSVGTFVLGNYVTDVAIEGRPTLAYFRFEGDTRPNWLGLTHHARAGLELRRESNDGLGVDFDVLKPHQVTFNGVTGYDRPRSYTEIQPVVGSAFYVDDRMLVDLGRGMTASAQLGLRLDLLHRGGSWFSGVRDVALQPRLNAELAPNSWLRFRGAWGRTAKAPSMAQLSPPRQYFDVVNVNWFTNDPAERLAVLTTFVRDPTNDALGFIRGTKAEAGIEIGPGRWAISLVGFQESFSGGIGIRQVPGFVLRDHYQLTDSTLGTGVPPDIIEPPTFADTMPILVDRPDNILTQASRGVELMASLPEIPTVRLLLQISGAWIETTRRTDALTFDYFGFPQFQVRPIQAREPYWDGAVERGTRGILTYRLVHHQPQLGLVITAILQHHLKDLLVDSAATDSLSFAGYITRDGTLVEVPPERRGDPEFSDLRTPRGGTLRAPLAAPQDWMLSVQVTKTFPLGGRLSFWAFNLLDRQGTFSEAGVFPRIFSPLRWGVELSMPLAELTGWAR